MKQLALSFKQKGFNLKQLKRVGDKAIYEKTLPTCKTVFYEVIHIKRHNGYTLGGQFIEPAEIYPSSSQWGVTGWSYTKLPDAKKRFADINV